MAEYAQRGCTATTCNWIQRTAGVTKAGIALSEQNVPMKSFAFPSHGPHLAAKGKNLAVRDL